MYLLDERGMVERLVETCRMGDYRGYILKKKVFSSKRGKWITDYARTTCHHLLALLFLEKPEGSYQVRFKNGVKQMIHVDNLEWK
ncbi:hypothetical protein D3C79_960150 [compost metagenome]